MNLADIIAKTKKVLTEDAGSEGMVYILKTKNNLVALNNSVLKLSNIHKEDELNVGRLEFTFPRDYGFALNSIKAVLGDIDIASLELLY